MKRSLAAPLLSAFMPGVGQILNRQYPKAGIMIFGFLHLKRISEKVFF